MTTEIVLHATYYFYRILNTITGKSYVGVTTGPTRRKSEHFRKLQEDSHHSIHLQASFHKYGIDAFEWQTVGEVICTEEYAYDILEIRCIAYFNSYTDGYNMSQGGTGSGNKVTCSWNGISYPSIRAAAEANNINSGNMLRYINKGLTSDEEIEYLKTPCAWNNVEYESVSEAARILGITQGAMRFRVLQGYMCDDDIIGLKKPCMWNGVKYESVTQAARMLGIDSAVMGRRILAGYTCDNDMPGKGSNNPNTQKVFWNEIEYPSIRAAAHALGIDPAAMRHRLLKGYTRDSDMQRPPK